MGRSPLKLAVIFMVLTGEPYDAGSQPFQDFETLVKLRNELAHLKPLDSFERDHINQITPGKSRPILKKLPSNILATPPKEISGQDIPLPLTCIIGTQAAAKWACNTVVSLVDAVVTALPASQYKTTLESYRDQSFQPIP